MTELKTHEGWKSKGLRSGLCDIILSKNVFLLLGVRGVVSHQKSAWLKKYLFKKLFQKFFLGKFIGIILC